MTTYATGGNLPTLTDEEHVAGLEASVAEFARLLTAAQDAGVSHAILLPRMMLAFRRSFGELPAGTVLPVSAFGELQERMQP